MLALREVPVLPEPKAPPHNYALAAREVQGSVPLPLGNFECVFRVFGMVFQDLRNLDWCFRAFGLVLREFGVVFIFLRCLLSSLMI